MYPFPPIPNLRHLRMVQVIGRVGGVSGAARELCTSQPAVTQAVTNLEAEIGASIFERFATGSQATPAGKQYLLRIDRVFEILDSAVAQLLGRSGSPTPAERLMTSTQLRAFVAASEQGRMAEIAESLALAPDSLLRSARSLERALGKPLFDRTAQGLVPNKAGEFLGREFRRALREIELARGEILMAAGASDVLELVIGTLPMAGAHELAEATRNFLAAHPTVKVRVMPGEYRSLVADLANSRIDLLFGTLRSDESNSGVERETLFSDGYCLIARPGHPLTQRAVVTPEDMARYPWVVPTVGTPRRERIEALFNGVPQRPRFRLETSSVSLSRALVLDSDTVTIMGGREVQRDVDQGLIARLPCPALDDVLLKGVTTNKGWLPTQAHVAFLDCLRAITSREAAQPAG